MQGKGVQDRIGIGIRDDMRMEDIGSVMTCILGRSYAARSALLDNSGSL